MRPEDVKVVEGELLVSSSALMELLKVNSRATLGGWTRQGCPKAGHGWWPLMRVLAWRGMFNSAQDEMSLGRQKLESEVDYKRAQAEAMELKNAVARGDYIPRDEIVGQLASYHMTLKRSLVGLSRSLSMVVSQYADMATARRVERELSEIIADALRTMSVGGVYEPEEGKGRRKAVAKQAEG